MTDLQAACKAFYDDYTRRFATEDESGPKSGIVIGGVDIAGPIDAVIKLAIEAAAKEADAESARWTAGGGGSAAVAAANIRGLVQP